MRRDAVRARRRHVRVASAEVRRRPVKYNPQPPRLTRGSYRGLSWPQLNLHRKKRPFGAMKNHRTTIRLVRRSAGVVARDSSGIGESSLSIIRVCLYTDPVKIISLLFPLMQCFLKRSLARERTDGEYFLLRHRILTKSVHESLNLVFF